MTLERVHLYEEELIQKVKVEVIPNENQEKRAWGFVGLTIVGHR